MDTRYAPTIPLPPYSYVPGHGLPHPVTDPAGHLYGVQHEPPIPAADVARLPTEPDSRRQALAALLAAHPQWLHALDLFNEGFYWEAHEAWESFWNALGRTSSEAQFVQGLILLAAAAVKVREGKSARVRKHTQRARELLGGLEAARLGGALAGLSHAPGETPGDSGATLGLAPDSLAAVVIELEQCRPQCWHTSRTPVVRVVASALRLAD
jgi:hypothetical protein